MRWPILLASSACALASTPGCSRTVFVQEGTPMRVGPSARMRMYQMVDGEWQLGANALDVPEGWYIVPPSMAK
jgi:hypothetical protein